MGNVAKVVKRWMGKDAVVLLQEIPRWGGLSGYTYQGYTVISEEGSDCGVLLPRMLACAVEHSSFSEYWCGILVGRYIFISAHPLDHGQEDSRAFVTM